MRMLKTRRPLIQLLRSTMLFSSNATNFFAITFIPLAKTASISLMAPLMVVPLVVDVLHLVAMLVIMLVMLNERLAPTRPVRWRLRRNPAR